MVFQSILFEKTPTAALDDAPGEPGFFIDLNLDQIIDAITSGKAEYNLRPFFYYPLHDPQSIHYRHEVMRDLENEELLECIKVFGRKMAEVRRNISMIDKLFYEKHRHGWFVKAAETYGEAVVKLSQDLSDRNLSSRGLIAFRQHLGNYISSDSFQSLIADTALIRAALAGVQYCLIIKGSTVSVRKYEGEIDYSEEVEKVFEKFKQGAVRDYRVKLPESSRMNHVEARILDFIARLYPDVFGSLEEYCARYSHFVDQTIRDFDREIQFYIAYLDFIAQFKRKGFGFCYPDISVSDKEICSEDGFDLALANKLLMEDSPIVVNDFFLQGKERVFIVSGPNQGGKTTFARTFGQLHYLASLGCPVPGRNARLFLPDQIFTHFEKEEGIQNLRGKLQDDLVRIHSIVEQATYSSVIIMNEIFTSTAVKDAIFLSKKVMERVLQLDALCVCVTFIDELASLSEKTVSVVSTVTAENPAQRTYKILRKPADGLAYALTIAEKHRLIYKDLKERVRR
jgi:DNA mismatch repair protein MutS